MKATIEFDLDDPSDRMSHMRCIKATDAYIVLFDISNKIRALLKGDLLEETQIAIQSIMSEIHISTIDLDEELE